MHLKLGQTLHKTACSSRCFEMSVHVRMQERDGSFNVRAVLSQHSEAERESHTIHRDCSQSRLPSAFESASSRGGPCLTPAGCVAQWPSCDMVLQICAETNIYNLAEKPQ